jgi:hypothetical protein
VRGVEGALTQSDLNAAAGGLNERAYVDEETRMFGWRKIGIRMAEKAVRPLHTIERRRITLDAGWLVAERVSRSPVTVWPRND